MKVKSNIISFLLGMIIMLPVGGYATTQIMANAVNVPVLVDGQAVNTTVYNIADKNYTSARDIAEAMGGTVEWKDGSVQIETPKTDLEKVAATAKNSCVMIYVYKDDKQIGQGSGWVYNGYIITAKHVADAGNRYTIFSDDSLYGAEATRVKIGTTLDVAVLKADIKLPPVKLGDSDKLKEGQELVSITSPGGNLNYIDECLYSGKTYDHGAHYVGISDTFMASGSSGGAVFDTNSSIIGLASEGQNGLNNAIPINDLKPILAKLK
jgi:S1-C subfamily serine protease